MLPDLLTGGLVTLSCNHSLVQYLVSSFPMYLRAHPRRCTKTYLHLIASPLTLVDTRDPALSLCRSTRCLKKDCLLPKGEIYSTENSVSFSSPYRNRRVAYRNERSSLEKSPSSKGSCERNTFRRPLTFRVELNLFAQESPKRIQ